MLIIIIFDCLGFLFSFKASKNDHIIVVNLFDEIDFVCPYYQSTTTNASELEYYLIYRVSATYRPSGLHKYLYTIHVALTFNDGLKAPYTIIQCRFLLYPRFNSFNSISIYRPYMSINNIPIY